MFKKSVVVANRTFGRAGKVPFLWLLWRGMTNGHRQDICELKGPVVRKGPVRSNIERNGPLGCPIGRRFFSLYGSSGVTKNDRPLLPE